MSATVIVPKHLARHFRTSMIDVEASSLKGALEILSQDYHLDGILLNPAGELQPFIRIVVDEELITSRGAVDLGQVGVTGKTIHIMTAFAGG